MKELTNLNFREAQLRLLATIRQRIRNGDWTERGFAKMIGVSQPHVHNVLKGTRALTTEVSDSMLKSTRQSILDLCTSAELDSHRSRRFASRRRLRDIFFLDSPIGPGHPWPRRIDGMSRITLPPPIHGPQEALLAARLVWDPRMANLLGDHDIAVLNTSERFRELPAPEGIYAVSRGEECLLRQLRPGAGRLYLVCADNRDSPRDWEPLGLPAGGRLAAVRGKVIWLGRKQDRDLPPDQRGRFLEDTISS